MKTVYARTKEEKDIQPLLVLLPTDLHARFKAAVTRVGTSMGAVIREQVEAWVAQAERQAKLEEPKEVLYLDEAEEGENEEVRERETASRSGE